MKRLSMTFISSLMFVSACLAEHLYKGKVSLSDELFDSTMDCGLNLDEVEKCVVKDRSSGQGESFCNDVKLYAGNKQKLMDANQAIKDKPATKDMHMPIIRAVSDVQRKYTHQFMDVGLTPEQIGKIPALKRGEDKNFKCKKNP